MARLRAGARLRGQRGDVLRVRALSLSAGAVPDPVCGRHPSTRGARSLARRSLRARDDGSAIAVVVARRHLRELAGVVADADDGDHREQSRHGAAGQEALRPGRSPTTSARSR